MTAEQFLADLEAKAKAATPGPWGKGIAIRRGYGVTAVLDSEGNNIADMEHSQFTEKEEEFNAAFIAAANPAAVLRLVGMLRFLAFSAARSRGVFMDPAYWLDTAYIATEGRHD